MSLPRTDFLLKLNRFFSELPFELEGTTLCVGLSGGADSVSLLIGLIEIKDEFGFSVVACHFNHMIRGEEADRDELFCKTLCEQLGVKIYCGRDDVPAYANYKKICIEQAARECRYSFFTRILQKDSVDFCVTAHNKNDDAETLLLNLIRGSGTNGASSILPYGEGIIRPLLDIDRTEIEAFLAEKKQDYVIDSTNLSNDYTRNYIRNVVIPNLQQVNPSVVDSLSRYADFCRNDRRYFDIVVEENYNTDLTKLDVSVRSRVIMKKFYDFSKLRLNHQLVNDIDSALFQNRRICLPVYSDFEVIVNNGNLSFAWRADTVNDEYDSVMIQEGINSLFSERVFVRVSKNNEIFENINKLYTTAYLSSDKIVGKLYARNRRSGDKIFINGMNKSLKKLFIEKKIPKEYRDTIPVFLDDVGIVYVPFIGFADRVCCNNTNFRLYLTCVFETIEKERWNNAYEKQG